MSNTVKIICSTFAIVILTAILIIGLNFNMMTAYIYGYGNYSNSEAVFQANPEDVKKIEGALDWENIILTAADTDTITVRTKSSRALDKDEVLRTDFNNGVLFVRPGSYRRLFGFMSFDFLNVTCEITVPKDFLCDYDISSASGYIDASDLHSGQFGLTTASGEIYANGITGENAELSSQSGCIKVEEAKFDDISASASSGEVTVKGDIKNIADLSAMSGSIQFSGSALGVSAETASGEIEIESANTRDAALKSSSGSISFKATNANVLEKITAGNSSGEIYITLPEGTPYDPEVSTFSGDADLKGNKDSSAEGAVKIEATTASGGIMIK